MSEPRERPRLGTSHRVYAVVIAVLVFSVCWATVAARPWVSGRPDPRLAALAQREQRLRAEATAVQKIVDLRMAAYRSALAARRRQIAAANAQARIAAAAPQVRVVNLPPLTITRAS